MRFTSILVCAVGLLAVGQSVARAAADDVEVDTTRKDSQQYALADEARANIAAHYYQFIFAIRVDESGGRLQLQHDLELALKDIEALCTLTDTQRTKLRLAGMVDTCRFFDGIHVMLADFTDDPGNPKKSIACQRQAVALRQKLRLGIFGEGSFFHKSLGATLSANQWNKYRVAYKARQQRVRQVNTEAAVKAFGRAVPLSREQHQSIVALLLDQPPPPAVPPEYEAMIVQYQIFQLADQIAPLLDSKQRTLFDQTIVQSRRFEKVLRLNAGLAEADDPREGARQAEVVRQAIIKQPAVPAPAASAK